MEVGEIRVHDRRIPDVAEHDTPDSLVVGGSVKPHAIENDVIRYRLVGPSQVVDHCWRFGSRDFQADQAIMIRPRGEVDRSIAVSSLKFDLGEHILSRSASQFRPAWKGSDSGVTGR